ncbi:MAG: bifunctional folylpolyglutamate synthase/dihydrofolate synthase [Archangium sp.]
MTPQQGLAHFAGLSPSSIKMGLERVVIALEKLGNPQTDFPALHVAGTNGKGSTCAIAASCLRQRYKTGLYTSPHLERPNERIQIDGVEIDDETFGRRIAEVIEVLGEQHELTYFEFGTIVAFWHFAKEAVEIAVIETGLGGRLDATTACVPLVTCVTPVDFDHMEYLGNSLSKIAAEKAGIFKPGVPIVLAAQQPEALRVLDRPGAKLEGRDFFRVPTKALHLRGAHQQQNLAVAMACLDALTRFPLTDEERRMGVSQTRWPGRLEEFPGEPLVVLDGAHNTSGVEVLVNALDDVYPDRPVHLVFGVFADKDSEPMMRRLFPRVAALYLTPVGSPRTRDPHSYVEFARSLNGNVTVFGGAEAALKAARASAPKGGIVVIAGSLFLVGQLRAALTRP